MSKSLPANVTTLSDSAFTGLLDRLRSPALKPFQVRALVRQLTEQIASSLSIRPPPDEITAIIVVLRSGLAMYESFMKHVPDEADVTTFHMGIFRDRVSLQPVEYYNKLPVKPKEVKHAYVLDPVIATGGTASAVVEILRDWGLNSVTFLSILSTPEGITAAAKSWQGGTKFVVGAIDPELDDHGYIQPGIGDIGDRLFGTGFEKS